MEIIKCLEKSSAVKDFNILVLEFFEGGFYIKIKATLNNNTELYISVWRQDTKLFISLARTKSEVIDQMG